MYMIRVVGFTLMIDPSGDAKHTGRIIGNTFERGISLLCAEDLKKELNKVLPDLRVVLTRVPGETIQPLQNAAFANRLQVDLYLSLYFYEHKDTNIAPSIAIFRYTAHPTDIWHTPTIGHFYTVQQAHLFHIHVSETLGKKLLSFVQNKTYNSFFDPKGFFAVPFQPLYGIQAPALALEIGLTQQKDYNYVIPILVAYIQDIMA